MTVHGLILLAHGARDPAWRTPFDAVVARVRERAPEAVVRLAFLELMAPSMADAGAELVALGCARVDVVPVFLGTGGHVRRDVPALLAALRESHPGVAWTLHQALGESPHVVAALADAALDAAGLAFAGAHDPRDGIAT
jgi:sirohydrochlorin cobaltochelatase